MSKLCLQSFGGGENGKVEHDFFCSAPEGPESWTHLIAVSPMEVCLFSLDLSYPKCKMRLRALPGEKSFHQLCSASAKVGVKSPFHLPSEECGSEILRRGHRCVC